MSETGSWVFPRQHRLTDVLGARVHLVKTGSGDAVTRRDTLLVLQCALDIGDRQARAAMSSYMSEGWTESNIGLNSPFGLVNSVVARIKSHSLRTYESRVENGQKGGRPRKPAWDVTAGSSCLANQPIVSTVVEPQDDAGRVWRLSGPTL